MTNELTSAQVLTLEVFTDQGDYAAAYHYIADNLGSDHAASSWFEAASDIYAHANGIGLTVTGAYANGANAVTDLFIDTDPSRNSIFELSNSAVSNAIAEHVLGEIIDSGGDVQDSAVQILQQDASVAVQDFGVPRGYWIGDHAVAQLAYPDLGRPDGIISFGTALSNASGVASAAHAQFVEWVTFGAPSRALDSHLDAQIALAEAIANEIVTHNGDSDPSDPGTSDTGGTSGGTTGGCGGNGDTTGPGTTTDPVDEPDDPSYPPPITTPDIGDFSTTPSPPYYDPGTTGPQPTILDLDGDGVEMSFGQPTFFDIVDDGFLVPDPNADGTRGAGDRVIDQAQELIWGDYPSNS